MLWLYFAGEIIVLNSHAVKVREWECCLCGKIYDTLCIISAVSMNSMVREKAGFLAPNFGWSGRDFQNRTTLAPLRSGGGFGPGYSLTKNTFTLPKIYQYAKWNLHHKTHVDAYRSVCVYFVIFICLVSMRFWEIIHVFFINDIDVWI